MHLELETPESEGTINKEKEVDVLKAVDSKSGSESALRLPT